MLLSKIHNGLLTLDLHFLGKWKYRRVYHFDESISIPWSTVPGFWAPLLYFHLQFFTPTWFVHDWELSYFNRGLQETSKPQLIDPWWTGEILTYVYKCHLLWNVKAHERQFWDMNKKISPPFSLFRANTKCVRDLLNLNLASWVCFRLEPICTNKEPAQENLSLTNIIGFLLHQC